MSTAIYRTKRALRTPLVLYLRHRHTDLPEKEKAKAEQFGYRRSLFIGMGCVAVDPHYYYRADLVTRVRGS